MAHLPLNFVSSRQDLFDPGSEISYISLTNKLIYEEPQYIFICVPPDFMQ